jgi:hypothetical protein
MCTWKAKRTPLSVKVATWSVILNDVGIAGKWASQSSKSVRCNSKRQARYTWTMYTSHGPCESGGSVGPYVLTLRVDRRELDLLTLLRLQCILVYLGAT